MWIDTHCHLGDPAFDADRELVTERMRAAGVGRALVIESEQARVAATAEWIALHPELALATGCHPHDASSWSAATASWLSSLWRGGAVRGAGEVQRQVFAAQLALAEECGLPAIIHAREADADVVAILRSVPGATVVLHSFSSGTVLRDAGLADGWYFSFSGMITFNRWDDFDTLRAVPDERLLIETDAPYLAPVPHRGKRNEPAHVAQVGRRLAELRGTSAEQIAAITTGNAERLFWSDRRASGPG